MGLGKYHTPFFILLEMDFPLNSFFSSSLNHLTPYSGKDVRLVLPGKTTMDDIDWLSIYNVRTQENYGSTVIPDKLNIPPSLVHIIVSRVPIL